MMSMMAAMTRKAPPAAIPARAGTDNVVADVAAAVADAVAVGLATVEATWIVVEATGGGDPVASTIDVSARVYDVCTADVEPALIVVGSGVL